jgi:hypothetical protein
MSQVLPLIACAIWAFFAPTFIALRRNPATAKRVRLFNLLAIIPICWFIALFWATEPEQDQPGHGEDDESSVAYQPILEHAQQITESLKQKGFVSAAKRIEQVLQADGLLHASLNPLREAADQIFFRDGIPDDLGDEVRLLIAEIDATKPT